LGDLLDITAQNAPSILLTKAKFHILVHIIDNLWRFGPAPLYATERYEAFNSVLRTALVLSNRQAPSRDAASRFAGYDRVKHLLTGGKWYDEQSRRWVGGGKSLLHYATNDHNFRILLDDVPEDEELVPESDMGG
jgi:hypothetical protein